MAPQYEAVKNRLKDEYDEAFKKLEEKLFAEVDKGPSTEADSHPARFLAKYFLDSDGQPDRSKTKRPILLKDISYAMTKRITDIPGLSYDRDRERGTAVLGWDDAIDNGVESEFDSFMLPPAKKQDDHTAQANYDQKLFLNLYLGVSFLKDRSSCVVKVGNLDTTVSLKYSGLKDKTLPKELQKKGIFIQMKEFGTGENRIAVIGKKPTAIDAEIARLKKEEEEEHEREKLERRYLKANREMASAARHEGVGTRHPLHLQHLVGSYRLQWHADDERCKKYSDPENDDDVMKINIFPSDKDSSSRSLLASFDFGLVQGAMNLALSRQDVDLAVQEQAGNNKPETTDGATSKSHAGDKRPLSTITNPNGVRASRNKRQKTDQTGIQSSNGASSSTSTVTNDNTSEAGSARPAHPNRVYFQFVCNETKEQDRPVADAGNKHAGYLDFDPDTGLTTAKGLFYLPAWFDETPQSISVFKVSHHPAGAREDVQV